MRTRFTTLTPMTGVLVMNPTTEHVGSLTVSGERVHVYSLAYTGGVTPAHAPIGDVPKKDEAAGWLLPYRDSSVLAARSAPARLSAAVAASRSVVSRSVVSRSPMSISAIASPACGGVTSVTFWPSAVYTPI